jgi:hypothetical protein
MIRDFLEAVRMWALGFGCGEAWWRVRRHHQTAKQMRRDLARLKRRFRSRDARES